MTKETKELIKKSYGKSTCEWTWKDDLKSIDWMDVAAYTSMILFSISAILLIIAVLI